MEVDEDGFWWDELMDGWMNGFISYYFVDIKWQLAKWISFLIRFLIEKRKKLNYVTIVNFQIL